MNGEEGAPRSFNGSGNFFRTNPMSVCSPAPLRGEQELTPRGMLWLAGRPTWRDPSSPACRWGDAREPVSNEPTCPGMHPGRPWHVNGGDTRRGGSELRRVDKGKQGNYSSDSLHHQEHAPAISSNNEATRGRRSRPSRPHVVSAGVPTL